MAGWNQFFSWWMFLQALCRWTFHLRFFDLIGHPTAQIFDPKNCRKKYEVRA